MLANLGIANAIAGMGQAFMANPQYLMNQSAASHIALSQVQGMQMQPGPMRWQTTIEEMQENVDKWLDDWDK